MPRFVKGSQEAKDYMAKMREKRSGLIAKKMPTEMEGGKLKIKVNKSLVRKLIEPVKKIGEQAGKPYSASGVNPFTLGYDLGYNVIGPAIVGKGMKSQYRGKGGCLDCPVCGGSIYTETF